MAEGETMRRRATLVLLALSVASATDASASHPPTVWDRAADPAALAEEHAHRAVEQLLLESRRFPLHTPRSSERLMVALHVLDAAGARKASDVRLRFDLGRVLALLGDDAGSAAVLEAALREAPDHPMAEDAYFSLAIAYARLGRPADEIAAYDEYLRRDTWPAGRANVHSNRAEAHMVQGDLRRAIDDYRASLAIAPDEPLAHWGLAVALDRSGDPTAALAEAKAAILLDPADARLGSSDVFFVPPYDRYWYEALGAMARARGSNDPIETVLLWEAAAAKWSAYIDFAADGDRWLALAKVRRATCVNELAAAKRKAGSRVPVGRSRLSRPDARNAP